jgi:hypothetical protein
MYLNQYSTRSWLGLLCTKIIYILRRVRIILSFASLLGTALGRDFGRVPQYKQYLQEIGFVDVVEKQLAWPIGTWARTRWMKMLGAWCKENVLSGLQGWTMAVLTRGLGMTSAEVELLLMEVRNDINSSALHAYVPM